MKRKIFLMAFGLMAVLFLAGVALAMNGGYDIPWWTVDGGGGDSSGTGYSLSGTIGQPDAGIQLTGGNYILCGGFWGCAAGVELKVYLPLVLR